MPKTEKLSKRDTPRFGRPSYAFQDSFRRFQGLAREYSVRILGNRVVVDLGEGTASRERLRTHSGAVIDRSLVLPDGVAFLARQLFSNNTCDRDAVLSLLAECFDEEDVDNEDFIGDMHEMIQDFEADGLADIEIARRVLTAATGVAKEVTRKPENATSEGCMEEIRTQGLQRSLEGYNLSASLIAWSRESHHNPIPFPVWCISSRHSTKTPLGANSIGLGEEWVVFAEFIRANDRDEFASCWQWYDLRLDEPWKMGLKDKPRSEACLVVRNLHHTIPIELNDHSNPDRSFHHRIEVSKGDLLEPAREIKGVVETRLIELGLEDVDSRPFKNCCSEAVEELMNRPEPWAEELLVKYQGIWERDLEEMTKQLDNPSMCGWNGPGLHHYLNFFLPRAINRRNMLLAWLKHYHKRGVEVAPRYAKEVHLI